MALVSQCKRAVQAPEPWTQARTAAAAAAALLARAVWQAGMQIVFWRMDVPLLTLEWATVSTGFCACQRFVETL